MKLDELKLKTKYKISNVSSSLIGRLNVGDLIMVIRRFGTVYQIKVCGVPKSFYLRCYDDIEFDET